MNIDIVPLPDPKLIPRYLIEQIKPLLFDVDEWYQTLGDDRVSGDKSQIFLGIIDKKYKIVGALWLSLDFLEKVLHVNFLTLDSKYQGNGKVFRYVTKYLSKILSGLELKKAYWTTTRPKAYERYGFRRSKNVLLEMSLEEYNHEFKSKEKRAKHPVSDKTATTTS